MKIQYKSVISAAFAGSLALAASASDIDPTSTGFNTPPPLPPGTYLPKDANVIIAGESGSESVFYYYTLAEVGIFTFDMSGGTGDADLYAKLTATPTTTDYDCRPYTAGNNETCTIHVEKLKTYHLIVYGYSDYSDVSLTVSQTEPQNGGSETDITVDITQWQRWQIAVPADANNFTVTTSGGVGDGDLYVRRDVAPTKGNYDCRPFLSGNEETCTIESPDEGMMHVGIHGFSNVSGVSMSWSFD